MRNVVFVSVGGDQVRIRLTNAFGTAPMRVGHASVAVQSGGGADAVAGTLRELRFNGRKSVTVPAGRELFSDPVRLRVAALSTLLVSVYVPGPTGPLTNHPFTAQGNFLASGDRALAGGADYGNTPCWMLASGVDVRPTGHVVGSVVALGDSITDTSATTGNANHRWPDYLARRLNAVNGPTLSVVNAGLGGNRVLEPREGEPYYGVAALDRLERDVFSQTGVRTVILMEGVNDIGFDATAEDLIAGLEEIANRTHAAGLRILGGTITPMKSSFIWTEQREQTWLAVNEWIRTTDAFDGVVDFAAATGAPNDPLTLNPPYDSGDGLHPNDAGTEAMAGAVDLSLLLPRYLAAAS